MLRDAAIAVNSYRFKNIDFRLQIRQNLTTETDQERRLQITCAQWTTRINPVSLVS